MKAHINIRDDVSVIETEESDFFSPKDIIGKILYHLIKDFEEQIADYPSPISEKEWHKILKEMVDGFKAVAEDDFWDNDREEKYKKADRAFQLLSEWWGDLWG